MKILLNYMKFYKKNMILGPFFKWLEAFFELLVPLVVAHMIDYGISGKTTSIIIQDGILLFVLSIVGFLSSITAQFFASRASQGIGTRIRDDLFAHIANFSYREIDEIGTSTLITRINNDVNQIQVAIAMLIRLVLRAPFLVIGASVMAFLIDAKLSLIFFITLPILIFIMYTIMHKSIPLYTRIQKKLDTLSMHTKENLAGVRIIRSFNKEKEENKRFDEVSDDVVSYAMRVSKLSSLLSPSTYCVVNFAIIAILWIGGIRINIGTLTQGEIIAFVNYMNQIILALFVVANLVILFTKANVSLKRILAIFKMENTQNEVINEANKNVHAPIFALHNVHFYYGKSEEENLSDLSFTINKGQSIGIIGGTGAGKSTLVQLMTRLYDASDGVIEYYGNPIEQYYLSTLRKDIAYVMQKANLFSGTIRENLCMANADASEKQIIDALKQAQAYDFVYALPKQLDTYIERGGSNFSGGQKQRLCIARALLQQAHILILDDASSALDYRNDASLRKAIKQLPFDTIIYISSRIASIHTCDRIIVLDDGKMVGFNTHEHLLQNCPIYQEIYASQTKEESEHGNFNH
ncbi:MAG: ABC transporter ATP-binding protein [Erysipelotrichia bacterium]|nr:ABC transporter ATP-binding protein [Erysipelotrichia bacterium]NCC54325.1 ABC transporter ATP-binding protein [Erysipelotrichia bacterium]